MADDKRKRGKPDRIRISTGQGHERAYWAKKFGVTQTNLREACERVGPMVEHVKKYLIERIEKAE